ncbi:hypothetical protein CLAIMM_05264 [Cladophialophora immunda]|nr:hypothetical protein CLAIMM_05264 [Cladophialophora immunda]
MPVTLARLGDLVGTNNGISNAFPISAFHISGIRPINDSPYRRNYQAEHPSGAKRDLDPLVMRRGVMTQVPKRGVVRCLDSCPAIPRVLSLTFTISATTDRAKATNSETVERSSRSLSQLTCLVFPDVEWEGLALFPRSGS